MAVTCISPDQQHLDASKCTKMEGSKRNGKSNTLLRFLRELQHKQKPDTNENSEDVTVSKVAKVQIF